MPRQLLYNFVRIYDILRCLLFVLVQLTVLQCAFNNPVPRLFSDWSTVHATNKTLVEDCTVEGIRNVY